MEGWKQVRTALRCASAHVSQLAVRYNEPRYLARCYEGALSAAVERECSAEGPRYADKSRCNLLAMIRAHDADQVRTESRV